MRSTIFAAASLAAAAAAAPSAGTITVLNQCESSVQLTLHNNGGKGEAQGQYKKGERFASTFEEGTHELRISPNEDPYEAGASITGLVYNFKDGKVKYDVYNIFGFMQPSLSVEVKGDDKCKGIEIDNEQTVEGAETTTCSGKAQLTLTLCPKEAKV